MGDPFFGERLRDPESSPDMTPGMTWLRKALGPELYEAVLAVRRRY